MRPGFDVRGYPLSYSPEETGEEGDVPLPGGGIGGAQKPPVPLNPVVDGLPKQDGQLGAAAGDDRANRAALFAVSGSAKAEASPPSDGRDASVREHLALTRRIAESIERRPDGTIVFPVNLSYASKQGARQWVMAAQDPNYVLREEELKLVEAFFAELQVPIDEIREFGPGDGYKAAKIMEGLAQQGLKYTAFDLNRELLSAAQVRLCALKSRQPDTGLQLDFIDSLDLEDPASIELATRPPAGEGMTVGMLLGQTLGNPGEAGRATMLRNILHACR